jgi:hypothetical protein
MSASVKSYLEDMLYDIKDYTGSTFSVYLTAMETEKSSTIVMADLKEISVGDLAVFEKNMSPVGFLFPTNITIEGLDLGQDEINADVLVVIALEGGDKDELAIKALRYAECFRQMVNAEKTLGGACDYARVKQVNYFGPAPGDVQTMSIEIILAVTLTVAND